MDNNKLFNNPIATSWSRRIEVNDVPPQTCKIHTNYLVADAGELRFANAA